MDTDQADAGGLDLLNAERGSLCPPGGPVTQQGPGGGSAETPANPTAAPIVQEFWPRVQVGNGVYGRKTNNILLIPESGSGDSKCLGIMLSGSNTSYTSPCRGPDMGQRCVQRRAAHCGGAAAGAQHGAHLADSSVPAWLGLMQQGRVCVCSSGFLGGRL